MILAVTILCVLVAILAFVILPDRTPRLDREILQSSRALWNEKGPADYDLSILIQVDRQDEARAGVVVRNGRLTSQSYNGLERKGRDDSYTIEGLLETMERELDLARGEGEEGSTILKAEFDQQRGFPIVFKKLTTRQGSRSYVIRLAELRSKSPGILFPVKQP